jgi:hypothetical protein
VARSADIAHLADWPTGVRQALLIATIAAVFAAGCGADGHTRASQDAAGLVARTGTDSHECPLAPARLAAVLRRDVRNGEQLRRLFGIRSKAHLADKAPGRA